VEGSIPSNLKKSIVKAVATCLGSGLAPVAPGTFGTVFGLLVYVLLGYSAGLSLGDTDMGQLTIILVIAIIVATILGTWATMELEEEWGHDPGKIVIDEVVGVWITLLFVPFTWLGIGLAFVLFRFFDILKPLGIKKVDVGMDSSFSVMLDDIIAGIYALISIHIILYFM